MRSARSAGMVRAPVLNARDKAALSLPFASAFSTAGRSTPSHAPRPGALARTSGSTSPSGETARRMRSPRAPGLRVRMHVLSGLREACSCSALPSTEGVSLGGFRNRVLPTLGRRLVLEPMGAGGHDDLVA